MPEERPFLSKLQSTQGMWMTATAGLRLSRLADSRYGGLHLRCSHSATRAAAARSLRRGSLLTAAMVFS